MLNPHLSKYKDIHLNDTALYFGIGKTLNNYTEMDGIKVGAGDIIYKSKTGLTMDYYFMVDPSYKAFGWHKDTQFYRDYKPTLEKFYRGTNTDCTGMPSGEDAVYYKLNQRLNNDWNTKKISSDITKNMAYGITTSLEIMQFLVYMGFKKIILIGHDLEYSNGSAVRDDHKIDSPPLAYKVWEHLKKWVETSHKDVKVLIKEPINIKIFEEYKG